MNIVPRSRCPVCRYEMDAASCLENDAAVPGPGDLTICMKCGKILVFADKMELRVPSISKLMNLPKETDAQLTTMQKVIRQERLIK